MSVTSTSTVLNPKDIVVRDALKEHQATLVFLHGLGDTGRGWCAGFYGLPNVKVVCPTAPSIPIDVNNGYVMPGWFDIYDFPIQNIDEVREDGPGILHSMKLVEEVVAKEKEANPNIPIFVGGFSQGGAIALTFAMRSQIKVSGLIALSCWLPLRKDYPAKESSANKDTPIFMGHGTNDQVVFESFGRLSFDYLKKLGRTIQYYSVPGMGHSAEDGEMEALNNFVKSHIKN